MPNRFADLGCALLLALVIPTAGQAQPAKKAPAPKATTAGKYNPPRMPDGHPDLSGTYDAATLTPLERMPGTKLHRSPAGCDVRAYRCPSWQPGQS